MDHVAKLTEGEFSTLTFAAELEGMREIIRLRWPPPILLPYQRKSEAAMTANERARFLCAFSMLVSNPAPYGWLGPFVDIHDMGIAVGMHYQHGTPRFLPWHRIYLVLLERQLRSISPGCLHSVLGLDDRSRLSSMARRLHADRDDARSGVYYRHPRAGRPQLPSNDRRD